MSPLIASTVERYQSGLSMNAIAKQDGATQSAICRRLAQAGVDARPFAKVRYPTWPIIEAYCRLGTWERAAHELGTTKVNLFKRAKRAGFGTRDAVDVRRLKAEQREAYREALDVDRLQHEDALEIAREY